MLVADAMIRFPKVCGLATTVAEARDVFTDDHVHAVLVADDGVLVAVVERPDLTAAADWPPARWFGRLAGRITHPDADLDETSRAMTTRRLAVVDDRGMLLGLLCRKRSGRGFCSDSDVLARATERAGLHCSS